MLKMEMTDLPDSSQRQLLNYLELLTKWNRVYNLTAVRDMTEMKTKHIEDSLAVLPYVYGTRILDVGTGAGLPGLVLAIARPDCHCVLLDSSAKKIRFIQQALIELNIQNVETVCTRIETFQTKTPFHTVISRAYASLSRFYTQTVPFITKEGCLLAMKGVYPETEIAEIADLAVHVKCVPLQIAQLSAQRHLVIMRSNVEAV
jgi:16S rRNA (guanine527-N7)-methyltransferase